MPEPYWPKKKGSYTLPDAEKHARLAPIRCYYCNAARYYVLKELRTLFGNIEVDDVTYRQRWRCTNCGSAGTLEIDLEEPPAGKRQGLIIRRPVKIEIIADRFGGTKKGHSSAAAGDMSTGVIGSSFAHSTRAASPLR